MGNLIEPYANVEFTFLGEPTIYSPYEYSVKNYIISFDIMDIWIYDNESGQVLARLRKRD